MNERLTIRVRTPAGTKRHRLLNEISFYDVERLKDELVAEDIFTERGLEFGLKMESKRKMLTLKNDIKLSSMTLENGQLFTVDFTGGVSIAKEADEQSRCARREMENELIVDEGTTTNKRKALSSSLPSTSTSTSSSIKSLKKSPVPVEVEFDSSENVREMAAIIITSALDKAEEKEFSQLGEFAFNMFIAAARIDAIRSGKVLFEFSDSNEGTSFVVSFTGNSGKVYQDKVNATSKPEFIKNLVQEVLRRTSTKRRRNEDGLRKIFTLAELAKRYE